MTYDKEEVTKLLVRYKNNDRDQQSFIQIYEIMRPVALIFAKNHMNNLSNQDCEDAVSRAFIKIIEKINTFTTESNGSAWIFSIVKNECYQIARQAKPHVSTEDLTLIDNNDYLQIALGNVYEEEFLTKLTDCDKQIFVLSKQGYSGEEIAEATQKSLSTVRRTQKSNREKMSAYLNGQNLDK